MPKEYISDADKVKLLDVMSSIKFSGNADVISRFKCVCCNAVALYQYVATCQHVYCDICQEKVYRKTCLAKGCSIVIDELRQDSNLEQEMQKLPSFCRFRKKGCTEEIPLYNYLEHTRTCQFDKYNTLPKLYKADPFIAYKEQNEAELNTLRNLLRDLQASQTKLQEEIKGNCDRIKEDILTDIRENMTKLEQQCQKKGKDLTEIQEKNESKLNEQENVLRNVQAIEVEVQTKLSYLESQCETNLLQKLTSSLSEEIKRNCDRNKEDILENITVRMSIKLEQQRQRESQALAQIEEDVTRGKEEVEGKCLKILQNNKEEILKLLENKLEKKSEQIEIQIGEHAKKVKAEINESLTKEQKATEENMRKEMDRKFQQMSSSLNSKSDALPGQGDEEKIQRLTIKYDRLFDCFLETKSTIFEWVIPGMRDVVRRLTKGYNPDGYQSDVFAIKDTELKMKAILEYDIEHEWLRISLQFVCKERNMSPDFIYYHRRKFILLNKNSKEVKRDAWTMSEPAFGTKEARRWMMEPSDRGLLIPVKNIEDGHITNNQSVIKIVLEPMSVCCKSFYSNNGVLLWKLENYKQKKHDELECISDGIWSESFYTSEKGYRMRLVIFFRQEAFIAALHFLRGEFDDHLPIVFPHFTRFFILDQAHLTDKKWLGETQQTSTVDKYALFEFDYAEVEHPNFLKNDCLLIKVVVEPTN